jgi:hypothetical protein
MIDLRGGAYLDFAPGGLKCHFAVRISEKRASALSPEFFELYTLSY